MKISILYQYFYRILSSYKSLFLGISSIFLIMFCNPIWAGIEEENKKTFEFAFMGDTGYGLTPAETAANLIKFQQMIDELNQETKLKFVVHIGDFKGGQPCFDEDFQNIKNLFNSSIHPLIYTPGDNEWVDCATRGLPWRNPLNALREIRKLFFIQEGKKSLGQHTITLKRQSDKGDVASTPFDESKFVENQRWVRGNVMFVTLHIPGSSDDCVKTIVSRSSPTFPFTRSLRYISSRGSLTAPPGPSESCSREKQKREAANIAWLNQAFNKAKKDNLLGVVILTQANLFYFLGNDDGSCKSGLNALDLGACEVYKNYRVAIRNQTLSFGKPVTLLQGDFHELELNLQPMSDIPYFTRSQTFGDSVTGWVRVTVDPNNPALFNATCGGVIGGVCPPGT